MWCVLLQCLLKSACFLICDFELHITPTQYSTGTHRQTQRSDRRVGNGALRIRYWLYYPNIDLERGREKDSALEEPTKHSADHYPIYHLPQSTSKTSIDPLISMKLSLMRKCAFGGMARCICETPCYNYKTNEKCTWSNDRTGADQASNYPAKVSIE